VEKRNGKKEGGREKKMEGETERERERNEFIPCQCNPELLVFDMPLSHHSY
jgi:hypothetical protein